MVYAGWASFGGVEIINSGRTYAWGVASGIPFQCEPSCDLAFVLGDEDYQTGTDAPWHDPLHPESLDFLGFLGLEISGLEKTVARNVVTDLPRNGAAVGPVGRGSREMSFRVTAAAKSSAGMDYGIAWLNAVLTGSRCDMTCDGATLCLYAQCPPCEDMTADECHAEYLRTVYQVGILDPPTLTQVVVGGAGCGGGSDRPMAVEVEYTLVAGNPYIYRSPVLLGEATEDSDYQNFQKIQEGSNCPDFSPPVDFLCDSPTAPPTVPIPSDPCTQVPIDSYKTFWTSVSKAAQSQWFEKVLVLEIVNERETQLQWPTMSVVKNPGGGSCGLIDNCFVCPQMVSNWVGPFSKLIVDGRTETATLLSHQFPGSEVYRTSENVVLRNGSSGIYSWPVLECATPLCIGVQFDPYTSDAADVTVRVYMVDRLESA